jgi:putative ABC transport system permease protein
MDMDDIIFMPVRAYQKLFDQSGLFGIRAKAVSQDALPQAVEQCRKILRRQHHGNEDFTIISQDAMMSTMGTILDMMTYIMAGIAAISLLVGGIGIMNILLVSVAERTREVGLRMAVGARRTDVLKQFLTESVLISLIGGAAGVAIGVLGARSVGLMSPKFQPVITVGMVAMAACFSAAVGLTFGVYPAWRAAALDPIAALRRE